MKRIFYLLILAVFAVYSCSQDVPDNDGTRDENKASVKDTDDKSGNEVSEKSASGASDCDEFLDNYEKWVESYLELLDKYIKNPMDMEVLQEYGKVTQEAATWATDWARLITCSDDEGIQERYDEIQKKIDAKLKELNLQ
ncbi:MAG: DUF6591 domain-containing protein [Bacteroidota bacterium]